ncbi:restriction endonuclease subunit S [Chroococcus sp. FPU101]|uniref:restriction endonuclease subunit S n=1 Tax=Chroococcus sp. FPU101 TaxID=1974212 RepID=UPI001A901307|nr:restriction endonuclease subunit S [Chroococcus sp. FPU101]GFE69214.1 hypothetical protein CFPU101_18240 [Chroococcus sp. FPU101]
MTGTNGKIADLPKGWIQLQLKEIFNPNRPKVSPQDYSELPFIGMEHISSHTMKLLGTEQAKNLKSKAVYFHPNDILYGRLRPYLNKVFKPDFYGLCSAEFIVFPENEAINPKLLQYFLNSAKFVSFASHLNEGDRPRVGFDVIGNYYIVLPPLPEQHRIVEKIEELFSELDNGVEYLKKARQKLKVYRQAILKWAFEGKLTEAWRKEHQDTLEDAETLLTQIKAERERHYQQQLEEWEKAVKDWEASGKNGKKPTKPQQSKELPLLTEEELSKLPSLPDGWCWVRLNEISEKITDGEHSTPERTENGYYLLSARNIQNSYLSFEKVDYIPESEYIRIIQRCNPEEGDILISCSGTIGRICRVPKNILFTMVRSVALIKIQHNKYLSKYLEYQLQAPILQKVIHSKKKATAQANLFLAPISELPMAIAPLLEQTQIVQEIESRLSICDKLEATITENLEKAEALRQSILKLAFEGKLVSQNPNDEPASELLKRIQAENSNETSKSSPKQLELDVTSA